jgi:molybdenum cofactor biosynthesis enzyme
MVARRTLLRRALLTYQEDISVKWIALLSIAVAIIGIFDMHKDPVAAMTNIGSLVAHTAQTSLFPRL